MERSVSTVHYDEVDGYARIRLANGVTNALTTGVIGVLSDAVSRADAETRGLLLCGGEKFFSNGVDLDWALSQSRAQMRELFLALGKCRLNVLEFPRPVVGAIRGHAAAGAAALFLACDYRYAALGRILIGKPEVLIGVPNPYYGDQLLRFVAGDFVASDLTGRMVPSEEAMALQLVHVVGASDGIEDLAWKRLLASLYSPRRQLVQSGFTVTTGVFPFRFTPPRLVATRAATWRRDGADGGVGSDSPCVRIDVASSCPEVQGGRGSKNAVFRGAESEGGRTCSGR